MSEPRLTASEVRHRTAASAITVGLREIAIRIIQLAGLVALARLLSPDQFGVAAVGTAVVTFAYFLADAGLGAALIRRTDAPRREDLQALLGLQLLGGLAIAGVVSVIGASFGQVGQVTAVMAWSVPLLAIRAPTVIVFERNLKYRPLVLAEVAEVVVYYGFAVAAAAAGLGVWSLAFGAVIRSAAGSVLLLGIGREGRVRPRLSWSRSRGLLSFGALYQAVGLTNLVRDQGINAGIAAIAGIATLGLWNLANRILQIPFLLFGSLWRVSFPGMSRLIETGEDPRPTIERGVALTAIATGMIIAPLVASAPAFVPALFGERWVGVVSVLPAPSLGLMIGGPVSVAVAGYLYAIGNARIPLQATIWHTAVWLGISLPLLPVLGLPAVGYGWLAGSLVDAAILWRAATRESGARLAGPLVLPTLFGALAAAVGFAMSSSMAPVLVTGLLSAVAAEAIYLGALGVVRRNLLTSLVGLTGRALRTSLAEA